MLPWVAFVLIEMPPRDIKSLARRVFCCCVEVVFCFVYHLALVNIFSICNRIGEVLWNRK